MSPTGCSQPLPRISDLGDLGNLGRPTAHRYLDHTCTYLTTLHVDLGRGEEGTIDRLVFVLRITAELLRTGERRQDFGPSSTGNIQVPGCQGDAADACPGLLVWSFLSQDAIAAARPWQRASKDGMLPSADCSASNNYTRPAAHWAVVEAWRLCRRCSHKSCLAPR